MIMWGRIAATAKFSRPSHFFARKMSTALKDALVKAGVVKDVIDRTADVQIKVSW